MNDCIKKKGDLSLNMIVMSIIALLVLVIIIYLFTTKTSVTAKGLSGCAERGGHCANTQAGSDSVACADGEIKLPGTFSDCTKDQQICCKNVGI